MEIKEIRKLIKEFHTLKHETDKTIRKFVVDKSINIDDRWELFLESKLGDEHWACEMPNISQRDLMEDLFLIRNETIYIDELLELSIQNEVIQKHETDKINQYKEFCLENFINVLSFNW